MKILFILIIFTRISLITNDEYIDIKNIDEIEKSFHDTLDINYNTTFFFFLTTDTLFENIAPIIVTHSMQLHSNFSKIYIKGVNNTPIFLINNFISYFSMKNIGLIFDAKKMNISIFLFIRNITKIRIDSIQILSFHSNANIFTFSNNFFFSGSLNYIIRNLTIKSSEFLSIIGISKKYYSEIKRNEIFQDKLESSLIMKDI